MDNENYISAHKIKKKFDISSNSLRLWAESGKIRFLRINENGKRIYNVEDINKTFGITESIPTRKTICYARVSSDHQKEDLVRQIEILKISHPETEIIKDIGSGLNFKRKGFTSLLEQIYSGKVSKVVVTFKDRLCRFGFEIVEWILKKHNTELVVLNTLSNESNNTNELAEDLLAITTVFVARNNGNRSATFRKQRKQLEKEKEKNKEEECEEV
jgi:predicted site-specific integrase-resolvase